MLGYYLYLVLGPINEYLKFILNFDYDANTFYLGGNNNITTSLKVEIMLALCESRGLLIIGHREGVIFEHVPAKTPKKGRSILIIESEDEVDYNYNKGSIN